MTFKKVVTWASCPNFMSGTELKNIFLVARQLDWWYKRYVSRMNNRIVRSNKAVKLLKSMGAPLVFYIYLYVCSIESSTFVIIKYVQLSPPHTLLASVSQNLISLDISWLAFHWLNETEYVGAQMYKVGMYIISLCLIGDAAAQVHILSRLSTYSSLHFLHMLYLKCKIVF